MGNVRIVIMDCYRVNPKKKYLHSHKGSIRSKRKAMLSWCHRWDLSSADSYMLWRWTMGLMTSTALCATDNVVRADTSSLAPEAESLLYGPNRLPIPDPNIGMRLEAGTAGMLADARFPAFRRDPRSYPKPAFSVPYPPVLYSASLPVSSPASAHWSHTIVVSSAGAHYIDLSSGSNIPMTYGAGALLPDRSLMVAPGPPFPAMASAYRSRESSRSDHSRSEKIFVPKHRDERISLGGRQSYQSLLPPPASYPESRLDIDPAILGVAIAADLPVRGKPTAKLIAKPKSTIAPAMLESAPASKINGSSPGAVVVDSATDPPRRRKASPKKASNSEDSPSTLPIAPPVAIAPPSMKIDPPPVPSFPSPLSTKPPKVDVPPPLPSSSGNKKPLTIQSPTTADQPLSPPLAALPEKASKGAIKAVENAAGIEGSLSSQQDVIAVISFLPESVKLDDRARLALDDVAEKASAEPNARLRLVAHAGRGDSGRRIALSRGIAVRKYLIDDKEVDLGRINLRIRAHRKDSDPINQVAVQILR